MTVEITPQISTLQTDDASGVAWIAGVGASAGLGAAIARRFARAGLTIAATGRSRERLQTVVTEITTAGGRAHAFPGDVGAPDILGKFDHVVSLHGHVHQTIFNKVGNLSSAGALSTSWPWPYPPVQLAYPGSQMNQADPANTKDGMGTQLVSLTGDSGGLVTYEPFAKSLTPWLENGVQV
jgi:hypothetical protein